MGSTIVWVRCRRGNALACGLAESNGRALDLSPTQLESMEVGSLRLDHRSFRMGARVLPM